MLALTLQVLRTERGYVFKHFTATPASRAAVNLSGLHVVYEMFFESMSAKALGRRSYVFAIYAISISPCNIESILPGLSNATFIFFELLF